MPRSARKAHNQSLFRQVNERIAEVASGLGTTQPQAFVCECSRIGCAETVYLPIEAYARLRDDPIAFVMVRGHEDPEHEVVVDDRNGYLVVRSTREPA